MIKNNAIVDSILLVYTNEILIDYKVISENKVLFIKKKPTGWYYYNVTKRDGQWERSISSGLVSGPKGEHIFDCNIIAERKREYLNRLKELQKN